MVQDFWHRWSHEYLVHCLQRYKWSNLISEPRIGDIVLVKEDNLPPARWLLGKVALCALVAVVSAGETREKRGLLGGGGGVAIGGIGGYSGHGYGGYSGLGYSGVSAVGYSAPVVAAARIVAAPRVVAVNQVVNVPKVVTVPQVVQVRKVVSVPQVVTVKKVVAGASYAAPAVASYGGYGYGAGAGIGLVGGGSGWW
ncbi:uncharacterized protein ACR2FA_009646 [Aphomia sociella]